MKHLIAALMIALVPGLASANTQQVATKYIDCSFTEPFFNLVVDLEKKTLTRIEPDWDNGAGETVSKIVATGINLKVDFTDPLYPRYVVLSSNGTALLNLTLNMQGSDGMSDLIFPLDAQYGELWGGCETDLIKAYNPNANQ